jgi:hypothetical protein
MTCARKLYWGSFDRPILEAKERNLGALPGMRKGRTLEEGHVLLECLGDCDIRRITLSRAKRPPDHLWLQVRRSRESHRRTEMWEIRQWNSCLSLSSQKSRRKLRLWEQWWHGRRETFDT